MARAKRSYPRKKGAYESIVRSGIAPHRLVKACHTGTYWRWEISNG